MHSHDMILQDSFGRIYEIITRIILAEKPERILDEITGEISKESPKKFWEKSQKNGH